ncbi:MAG: hypothetical protein IJ873_00045 [Lachnospiraceae bacterium]|nr:hypothetical protein [Lachnospiraceae bacterium]
MEFELWLFAVKNLAQTYEMSQVIFGQLPKAEQEDLRKEYRVTILGEKDAPKEDKTLKKIEGLIFDFHNSMNVTERFLERHPLKSLEKQIKPDGEKPEQEFAFRMLTELEQTTLKVTSYLAYLAKPVTKEGELTTDQYGQYMLEDTAILPGMLLEFFYHNRWELGKAAKDPSAPFDLYFLGMKNEEFHINPSGLHVRLR